jgi:hypothetical protein
MPSRTWLICGSCHTMVEEHAAGICSRCHESIHPSWQSQLQKFVEHGINPTYGGTPLPVAQEAASRSLTLLDSYERFIDHVVEFGDSDLKQLALEARELR